MNNPMRSKEGEATYRSCLVSYIDILGFKDIVESKSPDVVRGIVERLQRESRNDPAVAAKLEMYNTGFSDLVLRATPLDSRANSVSPDGLLFGEVVALAHLQIDSILQCDVFLRGALTVGELYFRGSVVFGPALAEAYRLESAMAVYPRILLDPFTVKLHGDSTMLKAHWNSVEDERLHLRRMLRKDVDGLWYIDYLDEGFWDADHSGYLSFLRSHKSAVLRGEGSLKGLDAKSAKFIWLAHYHNAKVSDLNQDEAAELLIAPGTSDLVLAL